MPKITAPKAHSVRRPHTSSHDHCKREASKALAEALRNARAAWELLKLSPRDEHAPDLNRVIEELDRLTGAVHPLIVGGAR